VGSYYGRRQDAVVVVAAHWPRFVSVVDMRDKIDTCDGTIVDMVVVGSYWQSL
jgi:hypothetical protein